MSPRQIKGIDNTQKKLLRRKGLIAAVILKDFSKKVQSILKLFYLFLITVLGDSKLPVVCKNHSSSIYIYLLAQRRTRVGRTPMDEGLARRRDLYQTTHTTDRNPCLRWDSNPQSQQTSGCRPRPHGTTGQPLY
jgi:hypothetical protein